MTDSGMADPISRTLALEVINAVKGVAWSQSGKVLCGKMYSQIKDLPAVDAVPVVHAQWIDYKDDHQCSACKEHTILDTYAWKAIQFEFCPHCGAKMDGERRDSNGTD